MAGAECYTYVFTYVMCYISIFYHDNHLKSRVIWSEDIFTFRGTHEAGFLLPSFNSVLRLAC